jgi:hypothetical protein
MLNEAANFIRIYGKLHIAQLAYQLGISVSKAYQLKPLILNMFSDVRFERGYFYVEKTEEAKEGVASQDAKR